MNSLMCATFGSIVMNVLYVVIAIVVLLTMVLIHELGHYLVGRKLGFKITEFSIGFGKALWQRRNKRGELVSFRIFPLGGYCAFLGETDDELEQENDSQKEINKEGTVNTTASEIVNNTIKENENAELLEPKYNEKGRMIYDESEGRFNNMRPWKRLLVYAAGVTFNFISAFLFSIIFLAVGAYDGYKISPSDNNIVPYYNLDVYEQTGELVELGKLQENTLVYAVNGENINYAQQKVFGSLVGEDDNQVILTIDGVNGEKQDILIVKAKYPVKNDKGVIEEKDVFGISITNTNISYGFGEIMRDFVPFTFHLGYMVLQAFWWIITGQVALNQLGGPISTISQMTVVASYGIANFMYLLPLLAVNLAIFNFLPIPGLDGAHAVFTSIEWIRGKPIKRSLENSIHMWGILLLFAFVIIIDIVHLITV